MSTMHLYRGDTGHFRFTCVDSAGVALDLSTLTSATYSLKASVSDQEPIVAKGVGTGLSVVAPASTGLVDLELLPIDTTVLDPGHYHYDLQLQLGEYVYTVTKGLLVLAADISTAPVFRAGVAAATAAANAPSAVIS